MKILWQIIGVIVMVTTFLATYGILVADAFSVNIWGLKWQYWAMIAFTIMWVSGLLLWCRREHSLKASIERLQSRIDELTNEDANLERERKKLEIEKLRPDTIQTVGQNKTAIKEE